MVKICRYKNIFFSHKNIYFSYILHFKIFQNFCKYIYSLIRNIMSTFRFLIIQSLKQYIIKLRFIILNQIIKVFLNC